MRAIGSTPAESLGLTPSAIVYSGNKGYWAYIKLSEPVPVLKIEHLNRGLACLLDGDNC